MQSVARFIDSSHWTGKTQCNGDAIFHLATTCSL
jgi:hypothetical protein